MVAFATVVVADLLLNAAQNTIEFEFPHLLIRPVSTDTEYCSVLTTSNSDLLYHPATIHHPPSIMYLSTQLAAWQPA